MKRVLEETVLEVAAKVFDCDQSELDAFVVIDHPDVQAELRARGYTHYCLDDGEEGEL